MPPTPHTSINEMLVLAVEKHVFGEQTSILSLPMIYVDYKDRVGFLGVLAVDDAYLHV